MLNNNNKNNHRTRGNISIIWIGLTQFFAVIGSWAIVSGGNFLRMFSLGSITLALIIPLMISLEAGLIGMIIFEPFRGVLRRVQYLIVGYSENEPIHLITPIVTCFAILLVLSKEKLRMFNATPLSGVFTVLVFICILQIFNPLQGGLHIGLVGALFYLIPMAWFYFGQTAKPELFPKILKLVVLLGIITSLYGVYQMTVGYPAFELYWLNNTDAYESINVYNVKRALATYSNAEEWGRYVLLGSLAAFGFASMKSEGNKRLFWFIGGVTLCGMLALTGQRSSIFGLFLGLAILFVTGAKTAANGFARIVLLSLPFMLFYTFSHTLSQDEIYDLDESRGVSIMVSHTAKGTIDPTSEGSLDARFKTWNQVVTETLPGNPLGSGLGAKTIAAGRDRPETRGAVDNYFLTLALSAGVPALILLLWILLKSFGYCIKLWGESESDSDDFVLARIAMALLSSFILNNFFGTSFVIYSVAPLGWYLLGWINQRAVVKKEFN